MRTTLLLGVALILTAAGGMQLASLHRNNTTLRAQLTERRALRENRSVRAEAPARSRLQNASDEGRPSVVTSEAMMRLTQLRADVAALEQRAAAQYAANSEQTDAPSANRDPERGMTKLEHLQNVGQGTPVAALQTLLWAAMKAEDGVMARTIGWDAAVLPKAQALIERLPAEVRLLYPTPEAFAALYISKHALDVSAIHISETVLKDASNAILTVKGLTGADERLPMHLGPNGWQLVAGEPMLNALGGVLAGKK